MAGKGTRIGRPGKELHKGLVPLGQKAVISHIIEQAPEDARIGILTGHRSAQVMEYLELAHPHRDFTFMHVYGWDEPGAGPGASLLRARAWVGDEDMVFTSCDTIWTRDQTLWQGDQSWAAVAPIPPGTISDQWCLMGVRNGFVGKIHDKRLVTRDRTLRAYTGLSRIVAGDLRTFWEGVQEGAITRGELQVTGGLASLAAEDNLEAREIDWTDVGTADAYASAVAKHTGYDFTKLDEATYVLPESGRVVKWWANKDTNERRHDRANDLNGAVPDVLGSGENMLAYRYTPGVSCYSYVNENNAGSFIDDLWGWAFNNLWMPRLVAAPEEAARIFYHDKTLARVDLLRPDLWRKATDALYDIQEGWERIVGDVVPSRIHGDFNFGNVLVTDNRGFVGIDWREDFGGELTWGDWRYDVGKLLAGCVVQWEHGQRGDFRPWPLGLELKKLVISYVEEKHQRDVQIIGALSLLNSAPLHAAPLDEVCVARGCAWLQEVL